MYDYTLLEKRIQYEFKNLKRFSEHLGKSPSYAMRYIRGLTQFSQDTIEIWMDALNITVDEIPEYFFKKKVDK